MYFAHPHRPLKRIMMAISCAGAADNQDDGSSTVNKPYKTNLESGLRAASGGWTLLFSCNLQFLVANRFPRMRGILSIFPYGNDETRPKLVACKMHFSLTPMSIRWTSCKVSFDLRIRRPNFFISVGMSAELCGCRIGSAARLAREVQPTPM